MKKVLVNGYFGRNFGDDLFFKILFERYKNTEFTFYSNSYHPNLYKCYKEIYALNNNVIIKKYKKVRKVFEKLNMVNIINNIQYRKFDMSIFIGGSIFMQNKYWNLTYKEKTNIINYFSSQTKPVYILGSNFGPYSTDDFKIKYENNFKKVTDICFREEYSYNLFNHLDNVRIAPDIVFTLKSENIKKIENTIGISIIDLEKKVELCKYKKIYMKKMKEIITSYIDKGKKITLFSFCEVEGDLNAINEILDSLSNEYKSHIKVCNYTGNINKFLYEFQQQENIIACRFHSVILSQVFGQGMYPIIYSDKTYNVLKDIDLNDNYIYIKDIQYLNIKDIQENIELNKLNNKEVFNKAEKQFSILDQVLC